MYKITIALTGLLVLVSEANAQNVPGRVAGTVAGVGSAAGQAAPGLTGSQSLSGMDLSTNSTAGGDLPGGIGVKVGDKVIKFRGAVGVGEDRGNVKAGVGVPF